MTYRNVFFQEIAPGHWVQINMLGEFDSDAWHALNGFLKRKATQAVPEQEASPAPAPETPVAPAKGTFGGECARTACTNSPATWKHRDMPKHYCPPCGLRINEENSDCDPPLCGPTANRRDSDAG